MDPMRRGRPLPHPAARPTPGTAVGGISALGGALLLTAALGLLGGNGGRFALAGEPGEVAWTAELESADEGATTLVVTSRIENQLHVYADGHEGVSWRILPVPGAVYGVADEAHTWEIWSARTGGVSWDRPHPYIDPNLPDEGPVPAWMGDHPLVLRIPVTLAADVAADAEIAVAFDYNACDAETCYQPIRGQRAAIRLDGTRPDPAAPRPGGIAFEASLEPRDLAAGQSGYLRITTRIEDGLHVYAIGGNGLAWTPVATPGVDWGSYAGGTSWSKFLARAGGVTWSTPLAYVDKHMPDEPPYPVWDEQHPLRIALPVTMGDAAGSELPGLRISYSACDEGSCYERRIDQEVQAAPPAGSDVAVPPPSGAEGGAEGPDISPPFTHEHVTISLAIDEAEGLATVTFEPAADHHLYLAGSTIGLPIEVDPLPDEDIRWGDFSIEEGDEFHEPYEVVVPFERDGGKRLRIKASWQACNEMGNCFQPDSVLLQASWDTGDAPLAEVAPPSDGTEPSIPVVTDTPEPGSGPNGAGAREVEAAPGERILVEASPETPFPVVLGDDLDRPRQDGDWRVVEASMAPPRKKGRIQKLWDKLGLLILGPLFVMGVLLALTPCVLPIIPLTISVIGGGSAGVSRGRLTLLLSVYVLGLALAYGIAGAASGFLGEAVDVEAAFRNPIVLWCIAGFFLFLAAGMLGIIEFQPPAWLEKMRGGAQRRSGTLLGSFLLGMVAAVVASPCTGPVIVGMFAVTTASQNAALGFLLFFTLGLGLGSVFFAAGSMNLLMKPGPWMVWVRYGFGIILAGVALFYVASAGLISAPVLFAIGFAVALLAWWAVYRHLVHREFEQKGRARFRGAIICILLVLATFTVAMMTRRAPAGGVGGEWIYAKDVPHLREEVRKATLAGRPVVVDVWGTWCTYCKEYDKVVAGDPYLDAAFGEMVRIKIDISDDSREDLREAVGLGGGQPLMAFLDEEGRVRRAADIERWYGADSGDELRRRVDFILKRAPKESASR